MIELIESIPLVVWGLLVGAGFVVCVWITVHLFSPWPAALDSTELEGLQEWEKQLKVILVAYQGGDHETRRP
jgi:hypothetical protein